MAQSYPYHLQNSPSDQTSNTWAWAALGLAVFPFTAVFGLIVAIVALRKNSRAGTARVISLVAIVLAGIAFIVEALFLVMILSVSWFDTVENPAKPGTTRQILEGVPGPNDYSGPIDLKAGKAVQTTKITNGVLRTPCYSLKMIAGTKANFTGETIECELTVSTTDSPSGDQLQNSVSLRLLSGKFDFYEYYEELRANPPANVTEVSLETIGAFPTIKIESTTSSIFQTPTTTYIRAMDNEELTFAGQPAKALIIEQPRDLKSPANPELLLAEHILTNLIMRS